LAVLLLPLSYPQPRVDYLAQWNAPILSVPETDNGWPIYHKAWLDVWRKGLFDQAITLPFVDAGGPNMHLVRPGEPGWEKVKPLLTSQADLIAAARTGSAKPHLGMVFGME
jgi:hypothetical protein